MSNDKKKALHDAIRKYVDAVELAHAPVRVVGAIKRAVELQGELDSLIESLLPDAASEQQDSAPAPSALMDDLRNDDFAKILRASNGQQVLFYIEHTEEDGNTLHCCASHDGMFADLKFGGLPDDAFESALSKANQEMADKVIAQLSALGFGLDDQ